MSNNDRTAAFFTAIRYGSGDADILRRIAILRLAERWHVPPWEVESHPEWLDDAAAYMEAKRIANRMQPMSEPI